MRQLIFGTLAGLTATMAMTAAMRRLFPRLPAARRYSLPPREIIERVDAREGEKARRLDTTLSHFAYGALAGALYALWPQRGIWPSRPGGVSFGLGVWAASYLGWLPAAGVLRAADSHPAERNLLMLAVHVVWGAALAQSLKELEGAEAEIFAGAEAPDAPSPARREL